MTVVPRRSPRHCSGALRRIPAIGRQSERRYGSERRKNGDGFPVPHANHQQCADDMAGTGSSTEPERAARDRFASSQIKEFADQRKSLRSQGAEASIEAARPWILEVVVD